MDTIIKLLEGFVQPFYTFGIALWNMMLGLIGLTAAHTPYTFSAGTWAYVSTDIYPWLSAIGASMMNVFFYIGYIRQTANLKQNVTLEILVELGIKVVLGNTLMVSGLNLMKLFFDIASLLCGHILLDTPIVFTQNNTDAGSILFYSFFGIIFLIVCMVCSITIFLTIYGRYLQLYLLVATEPLAVSTLPGGNGVSQTAYAWLRTFLAKVFEIVLILITLAIASKMCNSISFGTLDGIPGVFDGAIQAIQNIATMVLLAASVKGTDVFMKRAFAL